MSYIINLKNNKTSSDILSDTPNLTDIRWTAPEFNYYHKDKSWFIVPALIALVLLAIAIWLKNYTFAIIIPLAFFCLYIYGTKTPKKISFSISHRGVIIDKTIYTYDNLKSFWIFYDPPRLKKLCLHGKKTFMPAISIPLAEQNPTQIRALLLKYLPEVEQEESILDILMEKWRF